MLLSLVLLGYKIKNLTLRKDDGLQFIAGVVSQFLKDTDDNQEFTHLAIPEEKGYIEGLHSNIQRKWIDRYEFESIYHTHMIFSR